VQQRRHVLAVLALCAMPAFPAAADAESVAVMVVVDNHAKLPDAILSPAQHTAAIIFERAGIHLQWIALTPSTPQIVTRFPKVRFRIISKAAPAGVMRAPRDVPAITPAFRGSAPSLAYVLESRVVDTARRYGVPEFVVLGASLAHELGHMLLPSSGHTADGIMRPAFRQIDFIRIRSGRLYFTPDEATRLQAGVRARGEALLAAR
jgi:hypothetical protein